MEQILAGISAGHCQVLSGGCLLHEDCLLGQICRLFLLRCLHKELSAEQAECSWLGQVTVKAVRHHKAKLRFQEEHSVGSTLSCWDLKAVPLGDSCGGQRGGSASLSPPVAVQLSCERWLGVRSPSHSRPWISGALEEEGGEVRMSGVAVLVLGKRSAEVCVVALLPPTFLGAGWVQ